MLGRPPQLPRIHKVFGKLAFDVAVVVAVAAVVVVVVVVVVVCIWFEPSAIQLFSHVKLTQNMLF